MFPISHAYVASQVAKRTNPLLIFGSVLPDISTTSEDRIKRNLIHDNPEGFSQFVGGKYPQLVDLATGVRLHSGRGKGADYYSDDEVTGFAKIEGKNLIEDVADLLDTQNQMVSLGLAHNFIEAAVDFHLLGIHPEMINLYTEAMKVRSSEISKCLSDYLGVTETLVGRELDLFRLMLRPNHLLNAHAMVEGIFNPLIQMRFQVEVDGNKVMHILQKAVKLTEVKALRFLTKAIEGMRVDFTTLVE